MAQVTLVKTAQVAGEYKETAIDSRKKSVDFRLVAVGNKNNIVWKDGRSELVSDAKLQKLQVAYSWVTDF